MGSTRQRRKLRSGAPKTRQNAKKPLTKRILGLNPILRDNWDKDKTLVQNYRALGLLGRLNKVSGGVERYSAGKSRARGNALDVSSRGSRLGRAGVGVGGAGSARGLERAERRDGVEEEEENEKEGEEVVAVQEQRVERDPISGAILRIISTETLDPEPLSNTATATATARTRRTQTLNSHSPSQTPSRSPSPSRLDAHAPAGFIGALSPPTSAAAALEASALDAMAATSTPAARKARRRRQSGREREWCRALVQRHGPGGFSAMVRDQELNVWQQSLGDVRRRVERFLEDEGEGVV